MAPDHVVLGDGSSLRSDLTVWTAGVAAPETVGKWGLPQGKSGRLSVERDLRVEGSDRIFAVGDRGGGAGARAPLGAQPAIQEGKHAARQVIRLVRG